MTTAQRIADYQKSVRTITELLKGPMSDLERAFHVADRKDLLKAIAELKEEK